MLEINVDDRTQLLTIHKVHPHGKIRVRAEMFGIINILVYGLTRHTELFRNFGGADAFSMQFQNLYSLVRGKLCLAACIARIGMTAL